MTPPGSRLPVRTGSQEYGPAIRALFASSRAQRPAREPATPPRPRPGSRIKANWNSHRAGHRDRPLAAVERTCTALVRAAMLRLQANPGERMSGAGRAHDHRRHRNARRHRAGAGVRPGDGVRARRDRRWRARRRRGSPAPGATTAKPGGTALSGPTLATLMLRRVGTNDPTAAWSSPRRGCSRAVTGLHRIWRYRWLADKCAREARAASMKRAHGCGCGDDRRAGGNVDRARRPARAGEQTPRRRRPTEPGPPSCPDHKPADGQDGLA